MFLNGFHDGFHGLHISRCVVSCRVVSCRVVSVAASLFSPWRLGEDDVHIWRWTMRCARELVLDLPTPSVQKSIAARKLYEIPFACLTLFLYHGARSSNLGITKATYTCYALHTRNVLHICIHVLCITQEGVILERLWLCIWDKALLYLRSMCNP